jgi:hypothetical protein
MKFLTKLIACFLIAWLPIVGFPAQAPLCFGMSKEVSSSHEYQSVTASSHDLKHNTKSPCVKQGTVCQAAMHSLCCDAPGVLASSYQAITSIISLPQYRLVNRALDAQFVPEPPQRPPHSA